MNVAYNPKTLFIRWTSTPANLFQCQKKATNMSLEKGVHISINFGANFGYYDRSLISQVNGLANGFSISLSMVVLDVSVLVLASSDNEIP